MVSNIRITGLATGLDVDNLVKQMMKAHTIKVDKLKQDRQMVQWRQDLYRELIGSVNTFKSTYFDVLKSDKFMLSDRNFSNYAINNVNANPSVKVTTTSGVVAGDYKVTVSKLAESAKIIGTTEVNIEEAVNDFAFPAQIDAGNKVIAIKFADGISHEITLDEKYYYLPDLASNINSKLSSATNGDISKNVKAVVDGQSIKFIAIKEYTENTTLNITDNTDGKNYSIAIDKGTYGLDSLRDIINNKLKAAKATDGSSVDLSTKFQVSLSGDGSSLSLPSGLMIDGTSGTYLNTGMTITNSNNIMDGGGLSTNRLEYDRKIVAGVNDTLSVRIDGALYTINLTAADYGKVTGGSADNAIRSDLISNLKNALSNAKDTNGNTKNLILDEKLDARLSLDGKRIQLTSNTNKTITFAGNSCRTFGFVDGFTLSMSTDDKMSSLLGGQNSGEVTFTINDGMKDVIFSYDFAASSDDLTDPNNIIIGAKDKTIGQIMGDISSKANVKLFYSQLTRNFSIESNDTGISQSVSVKTTKPGDTVTDSFLTNMFGGNNLSDIGEDANVSITDPNGQNVNVIKSVNNFTIDGINYTLIKADNIQNTISVTANTQNTFDKIKEFVDKYNETIDKIYQKLGEKKQYKYPPLTDEQKKDMKESEIKNWEDKAKEGLIANDSTLENMLNKMRRAFFDSVPGAGISLNDIGLSTSSDISQRGKISIDEAKLQDALKNNGDKVTQLFIKSSSSPYVNGGDNTNRYNEEGIFQRINDILQDNLRTTRDINGKKGLLLEKAGIKGDYSEFHNLLSDQLIAKDKVISEMEKKLADKENRYYLQFAQLETAMQKMNDQSSWLSQQLGSMGGN